MKAETLRLAGYDVDDLNAMRTVVTSVSESAEEAASRRCKISEQGTANTILLHGELIAALGVRA